MQMYGEWRCVVSPTNAGLAFAKCVHTLQFSSFNPTLLGCKYELLKYTLKRNKTETLFSHKD